jgi:pimeloyl-ACP methyl ester carboxylesterase
MTEWDQGNDGTTVVLVHGAFADASGWSGVIERLLAAGVPVLAVSNPLRGITADADYVAAWSGTSPTRCSRSDTPTAAR